MWELDPKEGWTLKNWCFWTVVLEKTCESLGLQGDPTSPSQRRSVLGVHWKDWCWNSSTWVTSCKELTHWKRPWCWEGLGAGGGGSNRGWTDGCSATDGWMASPTGWTWVWVNSGSLWWTGRPGVLRIMGLQRVGHDWATELKWTELCWQSNVSAFYCAVYVVHHFSPKEHMSFNFVAAVTICSDFWVQNSKVSRCLHCFPIYLPWSDGTRCHDLSLLNVEF